MQRILISIIAGLLLSVLASAHYETISAQISCDDKIEMSPFVKVGEKYYYFEKTKLNWMDAGDYCRIMGAQLASFENSAERTTLSNYMLSKSYTDDHYWLSGNDVSKEGTFKWSGTGKEFANITKSDWGKDQPDNYEKNEHCITLILREGKFVMNDEDCPRANPFICEASNSWSKSLSVWYTNKDGTYGYRTCQMKN